MNIKTQITQRISEIADQLETVRGSLLYQNEDPYGPIVHLDFENWELVSSSLSS